MCHGLRLKPVHCLSVGIIVSEVVKAVTRFVGNITIRLAYLPTATNTKASLDYIII